MEQRKKSVEIWHARLQYGEQLRQLALEVNEQVGKGLVTYSP